jgi:hypothetical protein
LILDNAIIYQLSILVGKLEKNINNKKLTLECLNASKNRVSTDPLEARFEDSILPMSSELQHLIKTLTESYEEHVKGYSLNLVSHWALVQEKNMSCNLHGHGNDGCDLAAVYYPCENASACKLVFHWETDYINTNQHWFEPTQGVYYIFPAYLKHWVTRNLTEEPRVSISFNFKSVAK